MEATVAKAALETLCRNLSQGLHAAAQPLTILLAGVENPFLDEMSNAELREFVSSSAIEVERVCAHFSYLQELVSAESIEPELLATPLLQILANAIEGVDLLFRESGISIRSTVPDACQTVAINPKRTLAALSSVLLISHAVSHLGDTVEAVVSVDSPDSVQVVLLNKNAHRASLNTDEGLSMALAEANVRSQGATMSWSLEPFTVLFAFSKGVKR
jgi:hypothetical protein